MSIEKTAMRYATDRFKSILSDVFKRIERKQVRNSLKILESISIVYTKEKAQLQKKITFLEQKKAKAQLNLDKINGKVGSFFDSEVMGDFKVSEAIGDMNVVKGFISGLLGDVINRDVSKVQKFSDKMTEDGLASMKLELSSIDKLIDFLDDVINIIRELV